MVSVAILGLGVVLRDGTSGRRPVGMKARDGMEMLDKAGRSNARGRYNG